ncbi:MAG: flavodoxin-dependent (E)-4-hydroxy-3-methylbut-2-enyl-diphosphate synthase [Eubacterium sp.]|nr:flavodoxin-dependent (E)-4-hydroxy-3-methylbut-2-enyl-diphosphate synthase [Eubacterium sp.]
MTYRQDTKKIKIGDVVIGGGSPIAIQSMTNTETSDIDATVDQILKLEEAGCDIVRCTANTEEAARAFEKLKERTHVPLVADIHFQYKLAIMAIESGADKIRINPGNIGSADNLKAVVDAAKKRDIPIRVGVNSGSLEQQFIDQYGGVTAEGIVASALDKVRMIEEQDYDNIVISIKSSDVLMSVKTHDLIAEQTKYPLHVGITEAGTLWSGNIKSSVGLGIILNKGIGDTIRVSLTGDPVEEVKTAKLVLKTLGLRNDGITLVSCPTCGRTHIDLIGLANETEKLISNYKHLNIKVAVMGCAVNGPGEAREADLGIAGGDGVGLIFKKGQILRKVPQDKLLSELKEELDNWQEN